MNSKILRELYVDEIEDDDFISIADVVDNDSFNTALVSKKVRVGTLFAYFKSKLDAETEK